MNEKEDSINCSEFLLEDPEEKEDSKEPTVSANTSLINLSDDAIENAYYIPRKVTKIYNFLCYQIQRNQLQNFLTTQNMKRISPFSPYDTFSNNKAPINTANLPGINNIKIDKRLRRTRLINKYRTNGS